MNRLLSGGLFEYVSGANFLAESIEWTGFAICAWTLPAFAFAFFTWANIAFGRAIHHHQFVQRAEKTRVDVLLQILFRQIQRSISEESKSDYSVSFITFLRRYLNDLIFVIRKESSIDLDTLFSIVL